MQIIIILFVFFFIEMSKTAKGISEQESIARLQINAMYLSTVNKDLISKFPINFFDG